MFETKKQKTFVTRRARSVSRGPQRIKVFWFFFSKKNDSSAAGFTLLETLVALAIVGIGFAWAFGAMPESLAAQTRARNLEAATSLAESLLAQASAGTGTESRFAWQVGIAPFQGTTPQPSGDVGGQLVRVTVDWAEGANQRSITLQTIRLGTAPRGS